MRISCARLLRLGSALFVALAAGEYQLAAADDTAESYIEKHIQAVGGRERLQGIKSQVLTFEAQEGNQSFELEFSFKSGHKVLFRASLPNGFRITQGYSGEGPAWRKDPEGVREFNRPQDLLEFRELSLCLDVTAIAELKDDLQRLKLLAREKVDEVDCQLIEAQFNQGLSLRLYFALSSGLLTKVGQSQIADYQAEEGIKIPHLIRKPGGSVLKLKKVSFNAPLADSLFARPAGPVATVDANGRPVMMTNLNRGVELGIARRPSAAIFEKEPLSVLPRYKSESTDPFQVDLRSVDISKVNVTDRLPDLLHADFDTKTRWPTDLPADFVPNRILETAKNPGLNVRELRARGITGKGIGLAIIDQALLVDHIEYKDRLKTYEEIHLPAGSSAHMHGPAVASIAVGKGVGVAPDADLYYIAEMHGNVEQGKFQWDFTWLAQSIDRILELNRAVPKDHKIRVISISVGWSPNQKGCAEADAAVQRATAEGVFVVSTALERTHHLRFHGLGRDPGRNPDELDSYGLGSWWAQMFVTGQNRFGPGERLLVPMDARATASPTGENDYVFYANGGWSWCVPYIAGLYALACQMNPAITPEDFWAAALKTGHSIPIDCGGKQVDLGTIVDPVALIHSLQPGS